MPKPSPPSDPSASREALRRRIEDELADLGTVEISAWMMACPPPANENIATPASAVEIDALLGSLLWMERAKLTTHHCFHVLTPASQLTAVVQTNTGGVFVRERIAEGDLMDWQLQRRPQAASTPPPGYRHTTITGVLWRFALFGRGGARVLPPRYRLCPLALRQLPAIAPDHVPVRHVKLMKLLTRRPQSFAELQAVTGLSEEQLGRDLSALFLAGSLQTVESPAG